MLGCIMLFVIIAFGDGCMVCNVRFYAHLCNSLFVLFQSGRLRFYGKPPCVPCFSFTISKQKPRKLFLIEDAKEVMSDGLPFSHQKYKKSFLLTRHFHYSPNNKDEKATKQLCPRKTPNLAKVLRREWHWANAHDYTTLEECLKPIESK